LLKKQEKILNRMHKNYSLKWKCVKLFIEHIYRLFGVDDGWAKWLRKWRIDNENTGGSVSRSDLKVGVCCTWVCCLVGLVVLFAIYFFNYLFICFFIYLFIYFILFYF
jgi:hypothetical protein